MTEELCPSQGVRTFRAVLHPHRSLSRSGFLILLGFIGVLSLATSIAFLVIGAWPVLGFYGIDILALYIAFKLNYRAGKAYELVELSPSSHRDAASASISIPIGCACFSMNGRTAARI
jgi:uncharacterized membrane protein